jgi:spermidine/putrescine-binding protein
MTQDRMSLDRPAWSRRSVLQVMGAAGATALAPGMAAAQEKSIDGLMVNAVMGGPLRALVEGPTGVKVKDGPFVSSTDNVAKLMAPGGGTRYDLFIGVSEFSKAPAIGESSGKERVLAYDPAKVPNLKNLSDIAKADLVVRDGKTYLVPVYWGYDMTLYNKDHVPENDPETQSWGLLFSDKYAGRIAWFDVPHQMIMVAGLHLGMKEPEKATASDLAEITKFLIAKKKNVRTMWTTFAQAVNLLASGEVVVSYGWIPLRVTLQRRGFNITNNWPSDGLLVWSHGAFIPKDSRKGDDAQAVVNAMLSPEYGAALTRETGYLRGSTAAEALLSADEKKAAGYDIRQRGIKTYGLKWPSDLSRWVEAWGKVKSA